MAANSYEQYVFELICMELKHSRCACSIVEYEHAERREDSR